MVGIPSIAGIPEPANPSGPLKPGGRTDSSRPSGATDDAVFSAAAQSVAAVAHLLDERQQASSEEVRAERIAQARENIEQGIHQVNEVVRIVAARLSGYFPD